MNKRTETTYTKKTTGRKKTTTPKRTTRTKQTRNGSSKTKSVSKPKPTWFLLTVAALVVFLFVSGFYLFFIRPYAYRWKPCYGLKGYGVCMPSGFQVHGIDMSHYQGTIEWNKLAQARQGLFPIRFIFMKASEGGDYSDRTFTANFDSAKVYGFIRGAYHFYNPKTDANKQADFFIQNVHLQAGDLPPVLDIEKKSRNIEKLQSDLKIWLQKVEAHYGVKPIIYASYKYKKKYLNDSIFNTYPYWIAHYYVDSVRYEGKWNFWQHTDVGTLPGIEEQVDLNVFNGNADELNRLLIPIKKVTK